MSCAHIAFLALPIQIALMVIGRAGGSITTIPIISLHTLTRPEFCLEVATEDCEVMGRAREWPRNPDNVTCLDTDSNFILDSWTPELVRILNPVKGGWFKNPEVCTIHRDKADAPSVVIESVGQIDLKMSLAHVYHN